MAGAAAAAAAAGRPAALVWFRPGDLRVADHEPLHQACCQLASQQGQPLLLPFFCLDGSELEAPGGSRLGIPRLGPHRLRLLLEGAASLRRSLRQRGSDLLWAQGRPEVLVGRLVALAASQGSTHLALYHYMQPGSRSEGLEAALAAAFSAAAAEHGLPSSVHCFWGHTLYHPDDLPHHLFGSSSGACSSSSTSSGAEPEGPPAQQSQQQQQKRAERANLQRSRFAGLPGVMSDFRRPLQASTPVRPPLPAPQAAAGSSSGISSGSSSGSGSPLLPPLPDSAAASAGAGGLLDALPTHLHSVYSAAGPSAMAALQRLEVLAGLRCADLAAAGSGQHDPRCAAPFSMGEEEALRRLHYFLGLDGSSSSKAPVAGYPDSRMMATGLDTSAKLSGFVSLGCISPRTMHAETMRLAATEAAQQAEHAQQHQQQQQQQQQQVQGPQAAPAVAWREPQRDDTWRWLLMHLGIRDFFLYTAVKEGDALEGAAAGGSQQWSSDLVLFEKWARGQTGFPFVDACMRELAATGYMSNRGRQNVASFLSKGLGLDWRLGAEWLACLLGDHDESLNLLNWRYNCGVGHDPRTRTFLTVTQGERYDPQAELIRAWLPELARLPPEAAHRPWAAPPEVLAAAGVRLGEPPTGGAAAEEQQAGAEAAAAAGGGGGGLRWYPLPLVDPATQIGKGPKQKKKLPGGGSGGATPC